MGNMMTMERCVGKGQHNQHGEVLEILSSFLRKHLRSPGIVGRWKMRVPRRRSWSWGKKNRFHQMDEVFFLSLPTGSPTTLVYSVSQYIRTRTAQRPFFLSPDWPQGNLPSEWPPRLRARSRAKEREMGTGMAMDTRTFREKVTEMVTGRTNRTRELPLLYNRKEQERFQNAHFIAAASVAVEVTLLHVGTHLSLPICLFHVLLVHILSYVLQSMWTRPILEEVSVTLSLRFVHFKSLHLGQKGCSDQVGWRVTDLDAFPSASTSCVPACVVLTFDLPGQHAKACPPLAEAAGRAAEGVSREDLYRNPCCQLCCRT